MDTHDKFKCYTLTWDSKHFGVNSGRVDLYNTINSEEFKKILLWCDTYKFITISNSNNNKVNNNLIGSLSNAFLTDVSLKMNKKLAITSTISDENVSIKNNYHICNRILEITEYSFANTRFFNDPNIRKQDAKQVYTSWVKNSFNREDKYFAVFEVNKNIVGYIIFQFSEKDKRAFIDLIAVDPNFRGKKIGKSLLDAMEDFLNDYTIDEIELYTQLDSSSAVKFYIKSGFQYVDTTSIYHLWL